MILEEIRNDILASLSKQFKGYEIYGDVVRQAFAYPSISIALQEGAIQKDGARRHKLQATYEICIFSHKDSNKFMVLSKLAAALLEGKTGVCLTGMTFAQEDRLLRARCHVTVRLHLAEEPENTMRTLNEGVWLYEQSKI